MTPRITNIKLLIPAICFLFSLFSITAAAQTNIDRETAGLFGPVRSVKTKELDSLGKLKQNGDLVTYDQAGHEISREMVSDYGEAMGKVSQTFDAQGILTESAWADPKGKVISRDVFTYKDGKIIQQLTYNGAGALVEKTVKRYDAGRRLDADIYHTPDGRAVARSVYKYKEGNVPVEVAFFRADGRKATAPVGPCLGAHRITYTYDTKGRVAAKEVFEGDGTLKKSYQYKYDDKGNFMEYVVRDIWGTTTTFVYEYLFDPRGNWIKQTSTGTSKDSGKFSTSVKSEPYVRTKVTTREITYY
jgi:hypothetical protein